LALKPARLQWSEGAVVSADFGDVYFQRGHGAEESRYVFLEANRLPERFRGAEDVFHIAELGFGTGLNFLLTAKEWQNSAPQHARLFYASVEKHPVEKSELAKIYALWPELKPFSDAVLAQYPPLIEGFHHIRLPGIHLMLLFGDAGDVLPELSGAFDAWYLDGFSPEKNPGMWEERFWPLIAARAKPGGTLSTFSVTGPMRRGLAASGFEVKKVKGFGVKWSMTVASMPPSRPAARRAREVAVLGAGLAGCGAAYALARKGFRVTVADRRDGPARETSGNPAGILYPKLTLTPSPLGRFHGHGFCFTRALIETLPLPSWRACGVLHLDLDAEDKERTRALIEKNGYPPDYAEAWDEGLWQPSSGYLSPPELCAALLEHPNIETAFNRDIKNLGGETPVVAALGMGLSSFPETARLPLQSLRGQISYARATTQSAALKHVICHEGYITPAENGLHCIGATFHKEPPGPTDLREADHAENLGKLQKHLPSLGIEKTEGGRAGFRATTPDKLPMAGPCPDHNSFPGYIENLYVSTGFGAHGLSGAPLAGEIIACLIAGDPLPVPQSLMPYLLPERFILRALKRKNH
jgi:tRNA 5-methylaminomethyl-2-thiouridine biosynthesis bifunctional protein